MAHIEPVAVTTEAFVPRRPNLFIIGAPKSGTTSLYDYLNDHPDIYMSPVKEPFYFSPDIQGINRKRMSYPDGEQDYLDLFANAGSARIVGEASTRYLISRQAATLVKQFQPDARIVAILRNPVDMLHSLHNERVSFGMESVEDFEQALAMDHERMAGRDLRGHVTPEYAAYRPNARYGEQLQRWFAQFDRSRIHVMMFEDFVADTAGEFQRLLQFLGVNTQYAPRSFATRRRSHRRRSGFVGMVMGSAPARWATRKVLPALVGHNRASGLVWRFRQSRIARTDHERDDISPRLRLQLEEEFRPDVALLSGLLGRDLSDFWFQGEQAAAAA